VPESTEAMLNGFERGDIDSVATMFAKYAPYLRAIVRCQMSERLRGKFDSVDVVQSVWVHVLRQIGKEGWKIDDERQLRGLLATIARRRLIARVRRHSSAHDSSHFDDPAELDTVPHTNQPRPSEIAQAGDIWEAMLEMASPEHRAILFLKREGLTLGEIAQRTGLHEGSVRRILRQLASSLALQDGFPQAQAEMEP
jgi:RNA polymerase sigma factor (sigma-70 family)